MDYSQVVEIGRGGTGSVYEAWSESRNRPVVLKKIHAALITDPLFLGKLEQEALILSRLSHSGIVPFLGNETLHDSIPVTGGEPIPAGSHLLVTERVAGESLESRLRQEGPIPFESVKPVFLGICEALSYLHRQKIFHLDLKPSDVIVTENGGVVLTDFGMARLQGDPFSTLPGDYHLATMAYLSPEQASGSPCDQRSDLFSLGMIFYHLLEGKSYFEGLAPAVIWRKLVYDDGPIDLQFTRPVPEKFKKIVGRLVSKKLEDRYPSSEALIEAIKSSPQPKSFFSFPHFSRSGIGVVALLGLLVAWGATALIDTNQTSFPYSPPVNPAPEGEISAFSAKEPPSRLFPLLMEKSSPDSGDESDASLISEEATRKINEPELEVFLTQFKEAMEQKDAAGLKRLLGLSSLDGLKGLLGDNAWNSVVFQEITHEPNRIIIQYRLVSAEKKSSIFSPDHLSEDHYLIFKENQWELK